jgi:hypothetical protein
VVEGYSYIYSVHANFLKREYSVKRGELGNKLNIFQAEPTEVDPLGPFSLVGSGEVFQQ